MRVVFCLVFLSITNFLFAQDSAILKEIYSLIKFQPIEDTVNGIFHSCDTFQANSSIDKKIIAIVDKEDASKSSYQYFGQIFVLQTKNELEIIDSTALFDADARGPRVQYSNDTLMINHNYHLGGYTMFYTVDLRTTKFVLDIIEMENILHDKKFTNEPTGVEVQSYNIKKQELTIKVFNNDEDRLRSIKKIKKALPKGIIPDLAHFIDPFDDIYNEIWK